MAFAPTSSVPAEFAPQAKPSPFEGGKNLEKKHIKAKAYYNSRVPSGPAVSSALRGLKQAASKTGQ